MAHTKQQPKRGALVAKKIQTKTRRSNNEGSIFQRKSNGKWVGSITFGYDDKGQQKKKTVYGNSQTEIAKKLAEISGRIKSNSFNRFIRRNHLEDLNIHFHGLRHTFSNMLFELNENPKAIQQLLGHKDVKTTVYTKNRLHEIKFLSGENRDTKSKYKYL